LAGAALSKVEESEVTTKRSRALRGNTSERRLDIGDSVWPIEGLDLFLCCPQVALCQLKVRRLYPERGDLARRLDLSIPGRQTLAMARY
jgi:hypothetical protein